MARNSSVCTALLTEYQIVKFLRTIAVDRVVYKQVCYSC